MDSSRWRADPNAGGEGGFQVADPRQHAGVAYAASPPPSMLPFHKGAVEGMQGQAMGVPSGPGMSMPRMQSMIARPRLPSRPAPQMMPAGAGYVANASFSAQLAGGYAPPGVQSIPAGTAFGISGHVFPASQAMDGGYGCVAEPPWTAPCGQSSRRALGQSTQPTFGGSSIPSPSSCKRTSSNQSASMIDVDSDENGEVSADTTGWTPGGVGDGEGTWHDDTGGSSYGADEGDDDDDTSTQQGEMNDEDGGRRVEEGGVQGRPGEDVNVAKVKQQKRRGGRPPTANPKPKVPWTLDERIHLARMMQKDDALMVDANDQHRMMAMKDRYAWIVARMKDVGYMHRTTEDCRKKWTNMMTTAKLILDKQ
ncbi:hypothetical protein CBR_g22243 [Chara braunii]|uniref:Myb-like domain-containing protein n=1 Tax=Chara braunii TaxID=69332 RepID=A0A388L2G0_CHABU|nr:hypothetical protein CBR_g22243 [Chara braunii]|eukprot:GBG76495.1 hypothetical protein CBR_g22243 [Chara braunii]